MKYVLLSSKPWHDDLFSELSKRNNEEWIRITSKEDFTFENLRKLDPDKVFIPHWSYIIPQEIYGAYECVVFHMTDLPFGRGGSPLQNLIERGIYETKISGIKVEKGIDTGDVYLKSSLSLEGTAYEIFQRSANVIGTMISKIIDLKLIPKPQEGEVVSFKRRNPEESNISKLKELRKVYDFIRMLDCEGYPRAFIETESLRIEFDSASYNNEKEVLANVRIFKK